MARKLDDKIASVLKEHGFGPEACWDCHGVWVVYHKVLEQIAAKAGISFEAPQIVEANGEKKVAAMCVSGRLRDRCEWSIGEASPANNKNAYPWAMAEKRAKDRVILKLIGLHGFAYSEDEADEFQPPKNPPQADPRFITEEQEAELAKLITDTGSDKAAYLKYLGVTSLSELPLANFDYAKSALLKKLERAA